MDWCSITFISISNKMLGLNGLTAGDIKTEESETRRRRRTPSKYAESIKALTTVPGFYILD